MTAINLSFIVPWAHHVGQVGLFFDSKHIVSLSSDH
jgi:hypothetical protein